MNPLGTGDETPRVAFGKRLKELRERAGMTRHGLAQRSGVDYHSIKRFETGVNGPTLDSIARLAHGLSCDPADLLLYVMPDESRARGEVRWRDGRSRRRAPDSTS